MADYPDGISGILGAFHNAQDRTFENTQRQYKLGQQARTVADQQAGDVAMAGIKTQVGAGDLNGAQVAALLAGQPDLAKGIAGLADNHKQALVEHAGLIGSNALALAAIPAPNGDYTARQAAFDQRAPALLANGLTPQELAQARANLSDQGLAGYSDSAQKIAALASQRQHVADQQFEMAKQHDTQAFELSKPYTMASGNVRFDGATNQPVAQVKSGDAPNDPTASPASAGMSRPQRNNNPGNVKALPNGQQWRGQTGVDDAGFAVFGNPQDGIRAADKNLASYGRQGFNTVQSIISRWAPRSDRNNTDAYIQSVASSLGVDPKAPLNLSDPAVRQQLLTKGIFPNEGPGTASAGGSRATGTPGNPTVISNGGGDSNGGLSREAVAFAAQQAVANGGKIPAGFARNKQAQVAIQNAVAQLAQGKTVQDIIHGGQDTASQGAAFKTWNSGKNGTGAAQVRSIGVAVDHLDQLGQAATALQNGNVPIFNRLAQTYAQQTGKAAPTNFQGVKDFVLDEVTKAIIGSGGGVGDREKAAQIVGNWSSPAQSSGAIRQLQGLMAGQLHGLEGQYQQTTGRDDFSRYVSPRAQQVFGSRGTGSAPIHVTSPQQAAGLPSGTHFVTPDGRVLVKH